MNCTEEQKRTNGFISVGAGRDFHYRIAAGHIDAGPSIRMWRNQFQGSGLSLPWFN